MVKRRDLISKINSLARELGLQAEYTEGGQHTKVKLGDKQSVIPRHREINEITAQKILRHLEAKGDV